MYRTDTEAELSLIRKISIEAGAIDAVPSAHWSLGGVGAVKLGKAIIKASNAKREFKFLYDVEKPIVEKIGIIVKEMYGADGIELSELANEKVKLYTQKV